VYVLLWRFRVRAGSETDFAAAYGDDGAWARLFRADPCFLGTELMRGSDGTFLTIDRWVSEEAFTAFRERSLTRYEEIDAACAALTEEETFLGAVTA